MAGATNIRFGKASIRITGLNELFRALEGVGGNGQEAAVEVFDTATQRVFQKSQANVPVEEGNLKASGRRSKPRISKRTGRVTASVNYGGSRLHRLAPDEPQIYGIAVHEDPTGRGFKFLEKAMLSEKRSVMIELERRIVARLGKK